MLPRLAVGAAAAAATYRVATQQATTNVALAKDVKWHAAPAKQRTFIAVKPDGVARGLIGEIIARFEKKGYKLVGLKLVHPTKEEAKKHYADLSSKPFFNGLTDYFSSGPVVAMVWEGKDVVKNGRKLLGATNPADSCPGSIRGDLCIDVGRNVIHGSDSPESAQHEIDLWFSEAELHDWKQAQASWIYEKM